MRITLIATATYINKHHGDDGTQVRLPPASPWDFPLKKVALPQHGLHWPGLNSVAGLPYQMLWFERKRSLEGLALLGGMSLLEEG